MTGEKVGVEAVIDGMSPFRSNADEFNKTIGGMASQTQASGGIMSSIGDIAKTAIGYAVGTLAVDAFNKLKDAAAGFFADALAGEQQQAGLAALIKSTGGAAGLTADQVNDLANKFKDLAGGSDEAVVAIEEIGLRSGAINADEMPTFIQNVLDLGQVMGDASAAATLLARAQEDPIAALGKLQKAGIIFSDAQKEQIKTMVKAGDTAGATALIMARVAEATGGAAAANADTLAGRWDILSNHLQDAGKGIVLQLLPPMEQLFDSVIKPAIPIVEEIAQQIGYFFQALTSGDASGAFDTLYEGFDILSNAFPQLRDGIHFAQAAFGELVALWNDTLLPAIQTVWTWIQAQLIPLLTELGDIVLKGLGVSAKELGGNFTDQLLPDLQAAWSWMQANLLPLLGQLWDWLKVALPIAITTLVGFWNDVLLPAMLAFANWERDTLVPLLAKLFDWLKVNLPIALQTLADFWTNTLQPAIRAVWDWVQNPLLPTLNTLWTWLSATLTAALQKLSDYWTSTLQPALKQVWDWMNTTLFPFLDSLNRLIDATLGLTIRTFAALWKDPLLPAITTVYDKFNTDVLPILKDVYNFLNTTFAPVFKVVGDAIGALVNGAMGALAGIVSTISGDIKTLTGWINTLIGLINSIPGVPSAPGSGTSISSSPSMVSGAQFGSSYSSSSSVNYNYSPTYGSTPASPQRDFSLMKALAT